MSPQEYETVSDERDEEDQQWRTSWLYRHHPVHHTREFVTLLAVIAMSLGVTTMLIGYLIPRDEYVFDPDVSARENEAAGLRHVRTAEILDTCIVAGMGVIAVGGLMVSVVTMYVILGGDGESVVYRKQDRHDLKLLDSDTGQQSTYGAAKHNT